ncbi:MAG: glucose-1-phosphate adenylyltransferase [Lachnospiraceae bacterium]|nr:glucose-1-phosphate adenylyltransferase [Lachnospiraceae bacterium]MBO4461869.1 glucose-1-phosphate adenylyltransferase [Lachnospiraceae bacterium]
MGRHKKCIAMLLAGGQGSRLGALTKDIAKPAVSFGGKYRIIDFSLSNCSNSGIDTVGVLTQYRPFELNSYVGDGEAWDFSSVDGGVYILPPYETQTGGKWYKGTADAIYRNLDFLRKFNADYVLILSGDHLYRMNYNDMLKNHIKKGAVATISVMEVPWEEASRFGILSTDEEGRVTKFAEKPKKPESNLASMGIYIFNTEVLINKLIEDADDEDSSHDFGKNIIPKLLKENEPVNAYRFEGFWKDVGTIESYYETNMQLLKEKPEFSMIDEKFPIMSNSNIYPVQYIGTTATLENCIINNGCKIYGRIKNSIIGNGCVIKEGAYIEDSLILPDTVIEEDVKVVRSIVGEHTVVRQGARIGLREGEITVIGNNETIKKGAVKP